MSLWEEVKKNVVDLYSVTTDKTSEMAKVGSRRWDKFGISRDIERQFSELGNLVYTGLKEGKEDTLEDPGIAVIMSRIEALEKELHKKDQEIQDIHDAHRTRKAAEAAAGGAAAAGTEDFEEEADAPPVILKDPVLDPGKDESAILVEPSEDEDSGAEEGKAGK